MVSSVYESLLNKHSAIYARDRCLVSNYVYEAPVFYVSIAVLGYDSILFP
jgi:hypothetical protein